MQAKKIKKLKKLQVYYKIKNYPPSPKAMEDRGIMNYGRCRSLERRSASLMARRLDSSQDIRPALHDVYILCHGGKDKPTSFRAKRRIQKKTIFVYIGD